MKCTLFARNPKGVKLTQEGDVLYKYIEQAFNFISAAEKKIEDIKNLQSGEIRIGVSDTLCKHYLLPHLKHFNTIHPLIKIRVICPTTPEIINYLKAGKIDFGIINMPYFDERLNFKHIMEIQDCFVTGEKYKHLAVNATIDRNCKIPNSSARKKQQFKVVHRPVFSRKLNTGHS